MMAAPDDHIDYGVTQHLPGMGPEIGSVWRNKGSGNVYTIVRVQQRRQCWVTIRGLQGEREIRLATLQEFYSPHRY